MKMVKNMELFINDITKNKLPFKAHTEYKHQKKSYEMMTWFLSMDYSDKDTVVNP